MTTDPTPSPDVREIAAEITHARLGTSEPWSESPDWIRDLYREVADAVLAAVSPVIRAGERVKVAEELDEEADRIKRVEWPVDVALAHVEGFERAADFIGIPALRDLDRAIARTHAHPEEGK